VLTQVAERLRQVVRKGDIIARYSGDEFIMFISDVSAERADGVARKLMQDLREFPLAWGDQSFNISCSVGITMAPCPPVYTPEELISQADLACRQAKSQGRNRTSLFTEDAEFDSIRSDLGWHQRLEQALKNDEFVLHYQPIMSLADDGIQHFEVLVRLEEDGELRYPEAFLSAAVRFGLMQEVDHWVITKALGELSRIREQQPDIRFSINVTGSSFVDGTLAAFITEQLMINDLPASAIILEITEQVAIGSITDAVPQILELIEKGCEFAVDDFGTGYSSLSYLKRLPVQYIKIDGAFIQRLTVNRADQTIVRAIADIARIMGKRTVAEFVGDEETLQLIREMGIDYAQGFYVGKPGPKPERSAPSMDRVVPIGRPRKRG
jgi:EAL domain-containing protein (putative c-di-GMP-specific phosphodiesterase class I)